MFKWRSIIGLLALLGVLGQAGMIVRHNTNMVAAAFAHHDLVSALGVICHSGSSAAQPTDGEAPLPPPPAGNTAECPLCMGFGTTIAVLPERVTPKQVFLAVSVRLEVISEIILQRIASERPPARGPPSIA